MQKLFTFTYSNAIYISVLVWNISGDNSIWTSVNMLVTKKRQAFFAKFLILHFPVFLFLIEINILLDLFFHCFVTVLISSKPLWWCLTPWIHLKREINMPSSYLTISKKYDYKCKMYRSQLSFLLTGNGTQLLPLKGMSSLNLNAFFDLGVRNISINSVSKFGSRKQNACNRMFLGSRSSDARLIRLLGAQACSGT